VVTSEDEELEDDGTLAPEDELEAFAAELDDELEGSAPLRQTALSTQCSKGLQVLSLKQGQPAVPGEQRTTL